MRYLSKTKVLFVMIITPSIPILQFQHIIDKVFHNCSKTFDIPCMLESSSTPFRRSLFRRLLLWPLLSQVFLGFSAMLTTVINGDPMGLERKNNKELL